jgi:molybdate transport system substrate-binding protein
VTSSRLLVGLALLPLLLGFAACGDDDGPSSSGSPATPANRIPGDLTVFAAASLTEALTETAAVLEDENPGLELTFSFAGSGALVTQVQAGAPADLIAPADRASMQRLVDIGVVGEPVVFARNRLSILVAPGNPHGIEGLADLADPELKVVLADESVPAGRYAAEALDAAGVELSPVSKELDVKSTAAKVTSGEADAAIVYATDVTAAGDRGDGVEIPEEHNVIAEYPVAIVSSTGNRPGAEAYVEDLVSGDGQTALRARGFLAPVSA